MTDVAILDTNGPRARDVHGDTIINILPVTRGATSRMSVSPSVVKIYVYDR